MTLGDPLCSNDAEKPGAGNSFLDLPPKKSDLDTTFADLVESGTLKFYIGEALSSSFNLGDHQNNDPDFRKSVLVESSYDFITYTPCYHYLSIFGFFSFIVQFCLMIFWLMNIGDEDDQPPHKQIMVVIFCAPLFLVTNLSWTFQRVYFARFFQCGFYCYNFCFDKNSKEKITVHSLNWKKRVVVIFEFCIQALQVVCIGMIIRKKGNFDDKLINFLSLSFIIEIDELIAKLMHFKVDLIKNANEACQTRGGDSVVEHFSNMGNRNKRRNWRIISLLILWALEVLVISLIAFLDNNNNSIPEETCVCSNVTAI